MTVTESARLAGAPKFLERAIDIDTHEMIPFHMWGEFFGEEVAERLAQLEHNPFWCDNGGNTIVRPDITGDTTEITEDSVWHTKGPSAPSAFDLVRRCDVLNEMGDIGWGGWGGCLGQRRAERSGAQCRGDQHRSEPAFAKHRQPFCNRVKQMGRRCR